jgi:hypothetical protein
MMRPKLGQRVSATDRLVRRHPNNGKRREWQRFVNFVLKAKPVEGIYVGFRTYSNGAVSYDGDGVQWWPDITFEVWLVVPGPRQNPVPVFPEDTEYDEPETTS